MKKTYKNRAMRTKPEEQPPPKAGDARDKIKVYLGGAHRERAQRIADKMGVSLEELISRYVAEMVADNRWPR